MSRHAFLLLALAACAAADDTTSAGGRWKQQKSSLVLPDGSFLEQFATGAKSLFTDHWIPSQTVKEDIPHQATDAEDNELVKDDKEHFRYRGEWQVEEPRKDALPGAHKGDYGLVLKSAAAHHAISRVLDKPIVFKGAKTVLLQYEVKLQKGLECGGAYIKLLSAPTATESAFVPTKYSDKTPYTIMFGPDKCGTTNKVHFIFRFRNPKTGTIREHHLKDAPMPPSTSNKETHLYTLKIHPEDNTYEVLVDNESKKKGSLMDDFDPPVIPTKEIDDLTDKKPTSWVDLAKIPDPDATKPNDWDETAPKEIEDLDAVKPDDWLENEPEYVPDPDAQKPEDWSDEDDGEWVPLKVNNPKCESISGCGPWTRPMKKNPDYKGKWTSPLIDNPDYKGPWSPRKIPNPEYLDNIHAGYLDAIGAVGFELWTMQNDILFDNILVSNSINDKLLDQLTQSTWVEKHSREVELGKAAATKEFDEHEVRRGFNKKTLPLNEQLRASAFKRFITDIRSDPMGIAVEMPIIAILGMLSTMIPLLLLLSSVFGGGSKGGSRTTTSSTTATVDSTKKNKEQTDSLLKKKQDIDHDDNSSDIDYTATSTENGTTTSSLKLRSKRSNATKSSKKTDEHETDESATEDE